MIMLMSVGDDDELPLNGLLLSQRWATEQKSIYNGVLDVELVCGKSGGWFVSIPIEIHVFRVCVHVIMHSCL